MGKSAQGAFMRLVVGMLALLAAFAVCVMPSASAFAASDGPFAAYGAAAHIGEDASEVPERVYVYRLLVGFDGTCDLRDEDVVLGSLGNAFLLGFDTASDLRQAKEHYSRLASFASIDGTLSTAASASAGEVCDVPGLFDFTAATRAVNPFAALGTLSSAPPAEGRLIALVDTGLNASRGVARRVSVIGGSADDDNGHGSSMFSTIRSEDEGARVVSIKALDRFGKGTVSSVYAGIAYAIEVGADIVNLSFAGRASEECAAIEAIVDEATAKGIAVVVAAGNDGADAMRYCPANVESALTVGACSPDGEPLASSNWGNVVDAYVSAPLTSYAAARASGWLSAWGEDDDWQGSLIRAGAYLIEETRADGQTESPDEVGFQASASHATLTLSAVQLEAETLATTTLSATCSTYDASLTANAQHTVAFESFSVKATGNGVSGGAKCEANSAAGWKSMFKMYLTGNLATAYTVVYAVHGLLQQGGNGGRYEDGEWANHNYAAIDGVIFLLETKKYQHDTYVRFQQDDGSWGSYSLAESALYGYLDTVPAYTVQDDTGTYATATRQSYVAGYAAKNTYVDVARKSFTVSYAANGGWGAPSSQEKVPGRALTLSSVMPSRSDESAGTYTVSFDAMGGSCDPGVLYAQRTTRFSFSAWNTDRAGEGESYDAGASYTEDASMTLYAQWESSTDTAQIALPLPTRAEHAFDGWYSDPAGGSWLGDAGTLWQPSESTVLYAHWIYDPSPIVVEFDANGGAGTMVAVEVPATSSFDVPDSSYTRAGFGFAGWNTSPAGDGESYVVGQRVDLAASVTLHAQWVPLKFEFSVPGTIGFSARADGTLFGPSDESVFIENESDAGIAVTGMEVDVAQGYSVVDDAVRSYEYSFNLAPGQGDAVSLADYVGASLSPPAKPDQWRIASKTRLALNALQGKCGTGAVASETGVEVASLSWRLAMPVLDISYDVGDAEGSMENQRVNAGVAFALPQCPCVREGRVFAGWSVASDGTQRVYAAGERVSFEQSVTLQAIWV